MMIGQTRTPPHPFQKEKREKRKEKHIMTVLKNNSRLCIQVTESCTV